MITSENVHIWRASNPYYPDMINCDVPRHGFKSFYTKDDCINWLFFNHFKDSARELNKASL